MSVELDWSKLPKEAMWVAKDCGGVWYWYGEPPRLNGHFWQGLGGGFGTIPEGVNIEFSGEFEESLTPRPEDYPLTPEQRDALSHMEKQIAPRPEEKSTTADCGKGESGFANAEPPAGGEKHICKHGKQTLLMSEHCEKCRDEFRTEKLNRLQSERDRFRQALKSICEAQKIKSLFSAINRAQKLLEELK